MPDHPTTSAERLEHIELPGRADADIRPTKERYYPLDRPLPGSLEEPTVAEVMTGPVASYSVVRRMDDHDLPALRAVGETIRGHTCPICHERECDHCRAPVAPYSSEKREGELTAAVAAQNILNEEKREEMREEMRKAVSTRGGTHHYCPTHDMVTLIGEPCPKCPQEPATALPTSALARKMLPMATGLLDYFPAALVAVAGLSKVGNEQHNPGQPVHWARGKSGDEGDALIRHFIERGSLDTDGIRHSTKVAWRALALLQKELEEAGAPLSRGSR